MVRIRPVGILRRKDDGALLIEICTEDIVVLRDDETYRLKIFRTAVYPEIQILLESGKQDEISEDKKRRCNDAGYSQEKLCGQSHQLITSIL